jgi:hypothetical protein
MRVATIALSFALIFQTSSQLGAQQASVTVQQDPKAIAVLNQMIATTGWSPGSAPQDAVASGTVTRYQGEKQDAASVAWKFKGRGAARVEVQDSSGQTTTVINGSQAVILRASKTDFLPFHAVLAMRPLTLPFMSSLFDFSASSLAISFVGTETVGGQLANRIEVDLIPNANDPLSEIRQRAGKLKLWISVATSLPVQLQYVRISDDNPTAVRLRTLTFSDYRIVSGVAVPFHQEESAEGRILYSIQLELASLNVGLADSDFVLPSAQQQEQP